MTHIEKSIQVDVPIRVAYRRWAQFSDFLLFFTEGVKEVHQLDNRTLHWHSDLAGADVEWTGTIVFQEPDPSDAWLQTSSGYNAGSVTFQPLDRNRCRITSRLEFDPEDFTEDATASPVHVITRVLGDLKRFKQFIEAGGEKSVVRGGEVLHSVPIQDRIRD